MQHPVVFVTLSGHHDRIALDRAAWLASRFGAPLHALFVTSEGLAAAPPPGDDHAWFEHNVPAELDRACSRASGHLISEAIRYAQDHRAHVVVLPPVAGQSGSCVTAIATAAGVPVMVAREHTGGDAVVAATDLHDHRFPVLHVATEMIDHPGTTLVGVHNLDGELGEAEIARRRTELAIALESIAYEPEAVIACEDDPADGVLHAACERDADLIVVGAPPRSWLDSLLHPSVASRVVTCAHRSVLVIPLGLRASA